MDSKVILKDKNPHDSANIFSKTLLLWSFKFFRNGYKNGLTMDDLCQVRNGDYSSKLGDRLEKSWEEEIRKARQKGYKPSFSRAIVRTFWLEYMLNGLFLGIIYIALWPFIPYTLALFIGYFSGEKTEDTYRMAHVFVFLMNFLSIFTSVSNTHLFLSQGCCGMKVRIASCSLMYRKILKLGHTGLANTETGQVINLMSNDVMRFDLAAPFLNFLWVAPLVIPVVSYLVWQHIGLATLAALAVIFLQTVFVQAYLSNLQGVLRGKIAERTDERVKVMSELVNGVQVIKMYAWEKPFQILVDKLRKFEVKYIMRTSMIKGFSTALMVFTERFILFSAIVTFVLLGGDIRSDIAFSLVQYFNLLQLAANIYLPMALSFLAESKISLRRLEEFLLLDELDYEPNSNNALAFSKIENNLTDKKKKGEKEKKPEHEIKPINENLKPGVLILNNVSASWKRDLSMDTLKHLSLDVMPGEFVGVAGLVGSGKSSLLQLILGELKPSGGTISLGDTRISYASQEPWLFVATVRQNILFGLPYDRMRYKKVVTACALLRDFEIWPAGDSTLVGERGVSLSGGQRARIGLARACYRQADLYLLDDPLSAVDTHVGKHLVSECVMGLLRHSTRILVTHQLHHLKSADKVVILHNGEIETQGDFDEVSRSPLFAELLQEEEEPTEQLPQKVLRQRTLSIQSRASSITEPDLVYLEHVADEEQVDEITGTGRVSGAVYKKYFRVGNGWLLILTTITAIILAQAITSFSDLWLTNWMNSVESRLVEQASFTEILNNTAVNNMNSIHTSVPEVNSTVYEKNIATFNMEIEDHVFYIYIWAIGIVGCVVLTTKRSLLFLWMCMRSSIKLHNEMFGNIMAATMRFFDTNPSGRILNRFSKDMGVVDELLPRMYLESIQVFMVMMGILVMVAIVSPFMIITTAVCGIFMYLWTVVYLSTAQSIKRVEGLTRSPVFSHVSATMAGLGTVRACGAQHLLRKQFDEKQDVHTAAWYLTLVTNTAFSIWLSLMCAAYVVTVSYTFLLTDDDSTKSGNVGLAISQGLILVNMVQYGIKQATEVISQMTSVERVVQFTSLPQEKTDGPSPPANWPTRAKLVFKDLTLRYDVDSSPVLKKLNIEIESGWKVGVVGRTGAGKSSLISALFRLAPLEGHVYIDNVESGSIALKELRSKISIIPQEPVLFSASLRYNLDPFDKYSDAEIWTALEQVELKQSITSLTEMVQSGGTNYSAGQRQLLCLARAALGRNKLLVLDEATANVDPNTDALIQKSIRKHFAQCTVITVAHRLHTVADSDRVVVMEAGEIMESGHPHELLQIENGHFARMVNQLGPAAEQSLRALAEAAHQEHMHANVSQLSQL